MYSMFALSDELDPPFVPTWGDRWRYTRQTLDIKENMLNKGPEQTVVAEIDKNNPNKLLSDLEYGKMVAAQSNPVIATLENKTILEN